LDPMLSSRWVDPDIEEGGSRKRNILFRVLARFNALFEWISAEYRRIISWSLDHRKTVVSVGTAAFVSSFFLVPLIGSSFFPDYDRGEFQVNFTTSPDAGLDESRGRADLILDVLRRIPGVELTYTTIGAGETGTVREGNVYVKLRDKSERELTQQQAEAMARDGVYRIPGIIPSIVMAGRMHGGSPIMMNLKGDDLAVLKSYSERLKKVMAEVPGVVDVQSSLDQDKTEVRLQIDRARAVDVGLSSLEVVETLGPLIGGKAASKYEDQDGDSYDVRVRLSDEFRRNYDQIGRLTLVSVKPDGSRALVPVSDIAKFELDLSPARIQRLDLRRQVTLSANNTGIALGDAINAIKEKVDTIGLPPGYKVSWSGEAEDMAETFRYMAEALALAVILIYLILAAQFESFVAPVSIMVALPLSLVGVVGMLYLTGDTLNIMSLIGLIMLMGLVTKNAILLVDFTKILRVEGLNRKEALVLAGQTRLRPIVMTTLAMIFGMLPLALALGPGAEMRAPMARAVIGGLITSTLLTLIMVPVVYTLLEDFIGWIGARVRGREKALSPETVPSSPGASR
ncbi:MAG: efflux RND transporter permease subunit, partial [Syntrophobacteraceae bacterium]